MCRPRFYTLKAQESIRAIRKVRTLVAVMAGLFSVAVFAQGVTGPKYTQLFAGKLQLSNETVSLDYADVSYQGQLESLPYFGGGAQIILKSGRLSYGWEAGGFVSWKNDNFVYSAHSGPDGGSLTINFDNEFWSFETFMGLYAELKPMDPIRMYLGAGPLILFGRAERDDSNENQFAAGSQGSIILIDGTNSDTDIHAGYYARLGAEIRLYKQFWVGINIRYMDAELDLSDSLGNLNIEGNLFLLSVSRHFQ